MGDQKNLILAIVLSVAIILLFQMVIAPQKPAPPQGQPATTQTTPGTAPTPPGAAPPPTTPGQPPAPGTLPPAPPKQQTRDEVIKGDRVKIEAKRIAGSISLKGGMLDDVTLRDYRETVQKNSASVHLLNPAAL